MEKTNSKQYLSATFQSDSGAKGLGHLSPFRLFIIILASIFFAEVIAMNVVSRLARFPYLLITLTDAAIMVVLVFPILYLFSFRPLIRHIESLRRAEDALRQKEELNQRFFDSIDTMIAYMDCEFNYIRVNDAFAAARGQLPEYFIGKNHFVLYPDDESLQTFQEVVKTGEAYSASESPFEFPDQPERGTIYWNWSLQPVIHTNGLVDGVVLSQVDVTERKRAQQQVHEMALFPALNPNPVLQVDAQGRIIKSNPAADELGFDTRNKIFEMISDLSSLDLSSSIASGSIRYIRETRLGERIFQWTIRGAPDLELAFLYGQDITERKQNEEAIRLLSSVVEQTADSVVVTNCDGMIEYVNPAFEALTGYTKDESIGQTPRVLKSGVHDALFYRELWETVLHGQIFQSEISNRKKNGEIFHEAKTISPLRNERGEITRFVATGKDITERKQAEENLRRAYDDLEQRVQDRTEELRIANSELEDEINVRRRAERALQESEQRLERAQEIAHLGSWEFDLVSNQLTWSDEVYRIFGFEPQEFAATYDAFLEAVHPDDRTAVHEAYFGSIREFRDVYEIEHRVVKRSTGEIRVVHEKCEHFRDATGNIIRSVGMVHDITERKQVEEQLRYQAALLSSINDAVVASDSQYQLTAWNTAAETLYGWEAKEVIGRNGLEILHTEWPERDADEMRRMISETGRWRGEATQQRKDGSRFAVEVSSIVLRDAYGQITGYVSANRDITARKQAEDALRESEAKYRNLFENMTEEVHFWKLIRDDAGCIQTWRLVDANRPTLQTWGRLTVDEVKGKTADEILGAGAVEHYMPVVQKITTEGIPHSFEDYFPNLDKYFRFTSVPLGEYFITTGMDITDIKKAEQVLRTAHSELERRVEERTEELAAANRELSNEISERKEIERQLRIQTAAMEAAANGIMITDLQGTILWTNPAVTQISGYSSQDLIGQGARLFRSGRQTPEFYEEMWQSILAGQVWQGETMNRRKDGNLYIEEQTITPVLNEEGRLTHFIAIKQDITERKLIYSQLEESNRELKTLSILERQQRFLAQGLVESSMALNMSLDLHAVLDHIFEQTRRTIPYLAADIVLIEAGVASVVRQWGFDDRREPQTIFEKDNLKLQEFPTWERICESQAVVLIPDTNLERQWETYFGMQWMRSYLGAPLIYNDQLIGIINLFSDQANTFHEDMAKNLRAFAAPAAVAIQNARLYETEQQNRKAAEILSAASVALAQTLDIQMVMETILDYVQFILPTDVAFVILSEGDERYRIRAVRTSDDHNELRESLIDRSIDVLSDPMVRSYITSQENTYIPDPREVSGWNPPFELAFLNCWLGIPLESMGKILGVVVIAHTIPNSFPHHQIHLMEAVVKQAVVALQNAWLFDQVRSGRERLQQLSRHLVEIQENERKYIARELHDETSQSLTSLKIGLQVIEQKAAGHQLLLDQVAKLKSLADETLESLHRLAVNLRPASLDHLGLVDALNSLVETTRQRSAITTHFKTMGSMQATSLTEEMEASIYRIVQESLTNVIRHAQAAHVDIILEWQEEKVVVIIEDDGIGIDMQKARESGRLGLIGMQERAEMLGGKLLVDSTPQVGTTLVVEIPYVHSNIISR